MRKNRLLVLLAAALIPFSLVACSTTGPQGSQGIQGEQGETGPKGDKGDQGDAGKNGTSSLSGNGVPDNTLGNEGDTYTDFDTFNVYKKENGVWVLKGNLKNGSGSTEEGKNYTLTLDPDGGALSTTKFTVSYGRAFTLPVPTKNAYAFLGWMDSNDNLLTNDKGASIGVYPVAGDMTLKAKWNHTGYTLHYIIDGKEVKSENYDENSELKIDQSYNDPNFEGWYIDEDFSKKATSTSELTLKGNDKYVYGALSDLAYFNFYDDGNGYRVTNYTGTKNNVIIPSTYKGKPVTAIHANAFKDNKNISTVKIPNSVTSIGNYAFIFCSSLTSVNIPNSVTSIGDYAFFNCSSLISVNIPDSVTSIGYFAFCYCSSLTSINIPNSVTSIGDYAFSYCSSLISVNIPDSVTSIGYSAFCYCSSLTSINIPDSVTSIGGYAFDGCSSLTIYCEASTKPDGWDQDWNVSNRPVVWSYKSNQK